MLQNLSHKHYRHNNNIKHVNSTIKFIGFESFYYVIDLNVVSLFVVFNNFYYMFISIYY